ncbi:MAG TPA: phosphatase PAP2 family protein [Anaerolineales bacterium]|nr:phosphatase PAP2 family protein [Anaerolineales bacterium]
MNWMMLDVWLLQVLNRWVAQSPDRFYHALTVSDRLPWMVAAMGLTWMWFYGDPGVIPISARVTRLEARRRVLSVFGALITSFFAASVLQGMVPRVRPFAVFPLQIPIPPQIWREVISGLAVQGAFPSDHAVMFFALALGLWTLQRRAGWLMLALMGYFSALHIALGFHWPSDMLGGALIGVGSLGLFLLAERFLRPIYDFVLSLVYRYPGAFYFVGYLFLYDLSQKFTFLFALMKWMTGYGIVH